MNKILSHPLMQLLSFSIILAGSPYFGGPYLFFVLGSFSEGYLFGTVGVAGIVCTLLSTVLRQKRMFQGLGLLLMTASLTVYFYSSKDSIEPSGIKEIVPSLTLLLFIVVSGFVIAKLIKKINDA